MTEILIIGLLVVAVLAVHVYRQRNLLDDVTSKSADQQSKISTLRQEIAAKQEQVAQSNAFLQTMSSVTYDMVFVLDMDFTVIAINASAQKLFRNLNPVGEKLTNILDSPELHELVERVPREEVSLEEQLVLKDRNYRVRMNSIQYGEEHRFIGVALQDITQLVRLNRSRRDMVANISHELGTPIANIRLTIDSLFHDQDKPKRKDSISSLRAIAHETDTLQKLAQELLDLSMIESGQSIMKLVETPLIEVVEEVVQRVDDQLEAQDLTIVQHIPDKLNVLCDRDQTARVLLNLIHNAIKWSPKGEVITISAANTGETITISVFDNGPGVPDDQVGRVFERFFQVDSSRSQNEGTGLGLAICKHIIEAQGGGIWAVGNSAGGGGRFLFTLLNADYDESEKDELVDEIELKI